MFPEFVAAPDHGHVADVGVFVKGAAEVGKQNNARHMPSIARSNRVGDIVCKASSLVDFHPSSAYGAPVRWFIAAAAMLVLGSGCRSSSGYPSNADYALPRSVRLTLHGVTIAMGKYDGTAWDGPGRIAPGQAQKLSIALGTPNPYAQVIAILSDPVNQALAKPEVLGRAMLVRATGFDSSIALKAPRDTFTPQFAGPPSWGGIPLDGTVRLSVELSDDDVLFPDPMGSFQLNTADLVYALRAQNIVNVRVDGQTNRQILFAAISAMPE